MNHFKIQKMELLFVLICLFISVCCFHAVAFRSREHSKQMVCAANLHLNSQALLGYAENHDGNVMFNDCYGWLTDFTYSASDKLISYGSNRQALYCPSNKIINAFDPRLWQYSQSQSWHGTYQDLVEPSDPNTRRRNIRVISYLFLVKTATQKPAIQGQPIRDWVEDIDDISNPAEYEMITDETMGISSSGRFYNIVGGLWNYGITEQTNHLAKNGKPLGGNIGYVDGHVAWKPFEQMQIRCNAGRYFWW